MLVRRVCQWWCVVKTDRSLCVCGELTDRTEAERGGNEDGGDVEEERWSEKKTAERLQAVTADAKRGWQNVEQIFMDHERKSEKRTTNKKKAEASFQQLELIVLDD